MVDVEKGNQAAVADIPPSEAEHAGPTDRPLVHLRSAKEIGKPHTVAALTNRGPILVILVAYTVLNMWSFIGTIIHPQDPSMLFTIFFIISLVFEGVSVLLTGFALVAFAKTRVGMMGAYVWATIGLQLLGVAAVVLSILAPVPQQIRDEYSRMTETAVANNMPTDDIPTESEYIITRTLFRAGGLLLRIIFIIFVRKYYLTAKQNVTKN